MMSSRTHSVKANDVTRKWYVVDCSSLPLGRIATLVAGRLTGKHKPNYSAHIDVGDGVIVINAAQFKLTGNKLTQKTYYRHSGYPGALKQVSAAELKAKNPRKIVEAAVKGMLPKNKLQAGRLARLKVYIDDQHGMEAQKPIPLGESNGE